MGLQDRSNGFQGQFGHDRFLDFKIIARRNKKVGIWAAKLLGISPIESEKFINETVAKITSDPDDDHLVQILLSELKQRYINMSENQVRRQMGYFYQEARTEILNE